MEQVLVETVVMLVNGVDTREVDPLSQKEVSALTSPTLSSYKGRTSILTFSHLLVFTFLFCIFSAI